MRITESGLRRIIRQEVGRLTEMPARRTMVHTDPDEMPRAPRVSPEDQVEAMRESFALQQLKQHYPGVLGLFESQYPDAPESFLSSHYDMTLDGSDRGLGGQGFKLRAPRGPGGRCGTRRGGLLSPGGGSAPQDRAACVPCLSPIRAGTVSQGVTPCHDRPVHI